MGSGMSYSGCWTKAKQERLDNLLNHRPFRGEIIFTKGGKKTKRVRGGTYTVNVPDSYEARADVEETQAEINAAKMLGSVTPYVSTVIVAVDIAKGVEKAVETGNVTDALIPAATALVPKGVRSGLGVTKKGNLPDAGDVAGVVAGEVAGSITDD